MNLQLLLRYSEHQTVHSPLTGGCFNNLHRRLPLVYIFSTGFAYFILPTARISKWFFYRSPRAAVKFVCLFWSRKKVNPVFFELRKPRLRTSITRGKAITGVCVFRNRLIFAVLMYSASTAPEMSIRLPWTEEEKIDGSSVYLRI